MDVKKMTIEEFVEKGYLQEANRRFFHLLGLALEVTIDDNGKRTISGVWDFREDPEGIYYGLKDSDKDLIEKFKSKKSFIDRELESRCKSRLKLLGFVIEPIDQGAPGKFIKYEHHGNTVSVRSDLKGKHWDNCLCGFCKKLKPGTNENCEIAQAVYENCLKHKIVTPMWECPEFLEKDEDR